MFKKRSKPSFEQVYEEQFSYIYNLVYMMLPHKESAEDIVSEVFIKAMENYDRFDEEKASVKTWLATIAKNMVTDRYRSNARKQGVSIDEAVEIPTEDSYEMFDDDINQEVSMILKQLSPQERELLTMRYFMEMKNGDIAEKLGIAPKTVSERLRRLLQKCRKLEEGKSLSDFL